jgi:hypothetical protein
MWEPLKFDCLCVLGGPQCVNSSRTTLLLLGFGCNEYPTIESTRKNMNLLPMPEAVDGIAAESWELSTLLNLIAIACLTWYILVIVVQIIGITHL